MRLALVGTGAMGERIGRRLLAAGHELAVFNRTEARALPLMRAGAGVAATPRAAAARAEVVITMLADPAAVRAMALGRDGFLAALRRGDLWIDMSTVGPADSRELARAAGERGVRMLDAPVSGSLMAAEQGTLVLLVGGAAEDVSAAKPLFDVLSRAALHLGPSGAGSAAKLVVNAFLCTTMLAATEAVRLGASVGFAAGDILALLRSTETAPAWAVAKLEELTAGWPEPAFALKLADKDLGLVAALAADGELDLPLVEAVRRVFAMALAEGRGAADFSVAGLPFALPIARNDESAAADGGPERGGPR